MEYKYKLERPVYGRMDHVRMRTCYEKKYGGYVGIIEAVGIFETGGHDLIEKEFSREYYESGGDDYILLVPAGRRSSKREQLAKETLEENALEYLKAFLEKRGMSEVKYHPVFI